MTISIKTPSTVDEFRMIEQLQAAIWGSRAEAVPAHLLLTIAKEGGIVQLMVDGVTPIGFSFGFLSQTESGQLKLASHQAGVLPDYQGQSLGYRLKLAQREAALQQGLTLITWTYDPLLGQNARLNLHKLGAICRTYQPNLYGDMTDSLNRGLPSDRFRVDWWLESDHVAARLRGEFLSPTDLLAIYPVVNPARFVDDVPRPTETVHLPTDARFCLVEVPADLTRLKTDAPDLAVSWRLHTRHIFETLFERGYTAIDLVRQRGQNYYLLQKNWQAAQLYKNGDIDEN